MMQIIYHLLRKITTAFQT